MGKNQNRKSISLSKGTFGRLKNHATDKGVSMSSVVEKLIREFLNAQPVKVPEDPKQLVLWDAYERAEIERRGLTGTPEEIRLLLVRGEHDLSQTWTEHRRVIHDVDTPAMIQKRKDASERAEHERLKRAHEYVAWDNPCREPKCYRVGAHPEHPEDFAT